MKKKFTNQLTIKNSLLGFLLIFGFGFNPTYAQETEKQRLEKVQREMDAAKEKRDKLNEQAKATMAEISAIQSELIVQARQVQNKESNLQRISEDIILLEGETRKEEKDLMAKQKGMAQTLSSLERLSERPPALLLIRPQKGIDTLRSAKLLAATLPEIKTAADEIIRDITALKAARLKLRGEKDKQSSLLASLVDDRHILDDFLKRRQTKRSLLIADAETQDRRIQKLAKEAKDLSSLINKLELDRITRAKAAKEAEERLSTGVTKPSAGGGTPRPSRPSFNTPAPGSKSFRQAKGTMPIPARGRITQTFGSQLEAERAKGIRIQTRFGAQVIAPHDGTVVFSGPFRDYGNIVIIAHGSGYHSLFAGLLSENTSVGQWVLAGEPIGIMPEKLSTTAQNNAQNRLQSKTGGKSGGKPAGPSLYIEFRQNNKPFNPLTWLKRQRRKITG